MTYFGSLGATLKAVAEGLGSQIDDAFTPTTAHYGSSMGSRPAEASSATVGASGLADEMSPTTSQDACDNCGTRFNIIFERRKKCSECAIFFCSSCCFRDASLRRRTCSRCKILLRKPPLRADLMTLRVKDLQRFLCSQHINTKSCVEKKDLVELILRESGGERPAVRNPVEKPQSSAPSSYTSSDHRHRWMENMEEQPNVSTPSPDSSDAVADFVVVQRSSGDDDDTEGNDNDNLSANSALSSAAAPDQEDTNVSPIRSPASPAVPIPVTDPRGAASVTPPGSVPPTASTLLSSSSAADAAAAGAGSSPSRKFADRGLVYLSDIDSLEELNELSVKQMKDLLSLNRVHFKGVVEKEELLKIIERLWKQEKFAEEHKEDLDDSELCKVCMDNPVDCVMLECGHMCTCTQCGKQMNECPICRQYVVRVVKTFKA